MSNQQSTNQNITIRIRILTFKRFWLPVIRKIPSSLTPYNEMYSVNYVRIIAEKKVTIYEHTVKQNLMTLSILTRLDI